MSAVLHPLTRIWTWMSWGMKCHSEYFSKFRWKLLDELLSRLLVLAGIGMKICFPPFGQVEHPPDNIPSSFGIYNSVLSK